MEVKAYKLSSFTQSIDGGNPAGVVLFQGLDEQQMQRLAARIGFSETAFVEKSHRADYHLRFFTPTAEVELCGHATIAAFCLLQQKGMLQEGDYHQETKAGLLKIRAAGGSVYMEQVLPEYYEVIDKKELMSCLGINEEDFEKELPIQAVSTGLKDILVPVKNTGILQNLKPDMKGIEEISKKYNAVGLHVFALLEDADATAICRNFAPLYGIPEESATGTSNGALACYLHKYGKVVDKNKEMIFKQGIYMNKPSVIKAQASTKNNDIDEIWIGGEAVQLEEAVYKI